MAYSAFARYYDELSKNIDCQARAEFIKRALKKYGAGKLLLDAGCGTGTLSVLLAKSGCDVTAVDASAEMLCVAREKAADRNCDILFLQQDLAKLDLYGTVSAAVCMQDTLNHLVRPGQLRKALSRIALFLEPPGIFIFDVNTLYKHTAVLADNTFCVESENCFLSWQNKLCLDGKTVKMTLDMFEKQADGSYIRETEQFFETAWSDDHFESALSECGFEVLEMCDGESYKAVSPVTQRKLYVTRKKAL